MSNPIVHVEVVGEDGEALQSFYRDTFDWQMLPSGPGYAMAHPSVEGGINGGVGASPEGGKGHVTFYVEVGDLEAPLGKIERPRWEQGGGAYGRAGRPARRDVRRP